MKTWHYHGSYWTPHVRHFAHFQWPVISKVLYDTCLTSLCGLRSATGDHTDKTIRTWLWQYVSMWEEKLWLGVWNPALPSMDVSVWRHGVLGQLNSSGTLEVPKDLCMLSLDTAYWVRRWLRQCSCHVNVSKKKLFTVWSYQINACCDKLWMKYCGWWVVWLVG